MPVKLNSSGGGSVTLDVPATATATNLTVPAANGTIVVADNSGNVTYSGTTTFSGNAIFNAGLTPSSSFLRNRIINGDMRIDQRYVGGSVFIGASNIFITDRWNAYTDLANMTGQRSTVAPTGFTNSAAITVGTGASPSASQISRIEQRIEGLNFSDFAWGTASARPVTLSFWVRSSVTGTHSGALTNANGTRSYPFTFTISSANTWEYKSTTVPGDTTGTWQTGNGIGCTVRFNLGTGSSFLGAAGAWASSDLFGATGSVALSATSGATFQLTGVQLEVGSVATPFERRLIGQEILLCQRYYTQSDFTEYHVVPAPNATFLGVYRIDFPVQMRANPSVSVSYSSTNAVQAFGWYTQNYNFMVHYITASTSTNAFMFFIWTASAEL